MVCRHNNNHRLFFPPLSNQLRRVRAQLWTPPYVHSVVGAVGEAVIKPTPRGHCCAEMVDQPGVDIYGQRIEKSASESFPCNNCHQVVVASRYAPHLEKCMGMGRNSSRLARRHVVVVPL